MHCTVSWPGRLAVGSSCCSIFTKGPVRRAAWPPRVGVKRLSRREIAFEEVYIDSYVKR